VSDKLLDYDAICQAAAFIKQKITITPSVGAVLGSGLGVIAEEVEDAIIIPYADIPHFCVSGAPSHKGQLCIGMLSGVPVVLMQGRIHIYEGYSPQQVTFPIRVMKELGVETLIITNAAGGINKSYQVADLVLIEDHINLVGMAGLDPTRGPHMPQIGARFTPLNKAYEPEYINTAEQIAQAHQINIHRGVYAFVVGPCFETPAEIRFLSMIGADAVGMSTVPEVMAARNSGIKVLTISAITNMAIHDVNSANVTTEEEVWESVVDIVPKLSTVISGFLATIKNG